MSILNLNTPDGHRPAGKKKTKILMGVGLLAAVLGLGSTFAANISINNNNESEFGQGVTRTVFCGDGNDEEARITVTPLSKFVNESHHSVMSAPAVMAQSAVSFTFRFATSVYTSNTSEFIQSLQATKVVNGRTGVWLTNTGSSGQIASNQDETTFSSTERSNFVFSQNATTKKINNADVRGFYKVINITTESVVVTPAVAGRSAQYRNETDPSEFKFSGVVISDIPETCKGKNFIVSAYGEEGSALALIDLGAEDLTEITALWNGAGAGTPRVSKSRIGFDDISNKIRATQDTDKLALTFVQTVSSDLTTDDLYRLVIETQEDTLDSSNHGQEH
ncbi:hypothetical protein MCERH3_01047 [Candidatus Nanopelagicaceae bacterium]